MKLGDAITLMWQHGHGSNIHVGLQYVIRDDKALCLNDLREVWNYLNQDVPFESAIKEANLNRLIKRGETK